MGKGMLFVTILMIVGCGRHSRVLAGTITVYLAWQEALVATLSLILPQTVSRSQTITLTKFDTLILMNTLTHMDTQPYSLRNTGIVWGLKATRIVC
jgi:hypothetical protein